VRGRNYNVAYGKTPRVRRHTIDRIDPFSRLRYYFLIKRATRRTANCALVVLDFFPNTLITYVHSTPRARVYMITNTRARNDELAWAQYTCRVKPVHERRANRGRQAFSHTSYTRVTYERCSYARVFFSPLVAFIYTSDAATPIRKSYSIGALKRTIIIRAWCMPEVNCSSVVNVTNFVKEKITSHAVLVVVVVVVRGYK